MVKNDDLQESLNDTYSLQTPIDKALRSLAGIDFTLRVTKGQYNTINEIDRAIIGLKPEIFREGADARQFVDEEIIRFFNLFCITYFIADPLIQLVANGKHHTVYGQRREALHHALSSIEWDENGPASGDTFQFKQFDNDFFAFGMRVSRDVVVVDGAHMHLLFHGRLDPTLHETQTSASVNRGELFDSVEHFAGVFCRQISIWLARRGEIRDNVFRDRLAQAFFQNDLKPSQCWRKLVAEMISLQPEWRVLALPEKPFVQFLRVIDKAMFLRVVATSDEEIDEDDDGPDVGEPDLIRNIGIDASVSGVMFQPEHRDRLYKIVDLRSTEYSGFYKAYRNRPAEMELLFRVSDEAGTFGILNVEFEHAASVQAANIEGFLRAVREVTPFVVGLGRREQAYQAKEDLLMNLFTDVLKRSGASFTHNLQQPILIAQTSADILRKQAAAALSRLSEDAEAQQDLAAYKDEFFKRTESVKAELAQISNEIDMFVRRLPDFISREAMPVPAALEQRLRAFITYAEKNGVDVTIRRESADQDAGEAKVRASAIFLEHMVSLVQNAYEAASARVVKSEVERGLVDVSVSVVAPTDLRQKPLGTKYVIIRVTDNGGGADPDLLSRGKIGAMSFTTKSGGTGVGLASAREYFESQSGALDFRNKDDGFSVRVTMPHADLFEPQ